MFLTFHPFILIFVIIYLNLTIIVHNIICITIYLFFNIVYFSLNCILHFYTFHLCIDIFKKVYQNQSKRLGIVADFLAKYPVEKVF